MNNVIGDTLARDWNAIRHPGQHTTQDQPQESRMSRITDAKAAIDHAAQQLAGIGSNPLADAIADAALGKTFTPGDISLVLAMIRAIEHGPGLATPAPAQDPQQQTAAQQLQPQQPV